jgi:hypothetical protein
VFKQITYISILSLLLLQIVGNFSLFKLKQWDIRREMELIIKENLLNERVQMITISDDNKTQLKWERAGKEFWFEGNLYDVVRSEIKGKFTVYYCLNDAKETDLCVNYDKNIKNSIAASDTKGMPFGDNMQKIIKVYFPSQCNNSTQLTAFYVPKRLKLPMTRRQFYISFYYNLIDPPPKPLA